MSTSRIAIAAASILLLVGCATSAPDQYKSGSDKPTVSISDEGLSFWSDVPADDIRIPNSNVFVGGAAQSFYVVGAVLVDNTSAGNARISKQIPPEFGVAIAPILTQSMQRSADALKTQLAISNVHTDSTELQMKPLVRLLHVGGGRFNVAPQVKVEFLDPNNKRQFRNYIYGSSLYLPATGDAPSWSANNLQLYKRHLSHAYDVLTKAVLLDRQGAFKASLAAPEPTVVREVKAGFATNKLVLVAEFDKVRVVHGMVGAAKNTYHFIVEDLRSPEELLGL